MRAANSQRSPPRRPPAALPPSLAMDRHKELRTALRSATLAALQSDPRNEKRTQAKLRSFELSKHQFELAKHCETRSVAGRLDLLPKDHKAALAACFDSLPKQYDTADGVGKLALEELAHALASLGYEQDAIVTMLHDADTGDGVGRRRTVQDADGEARIDLEEFTSLVGRLPASDLVRERLNSIGKVIKAADQEAEAASADELAGPRYARSRKATSRRSEALEGLRDLASQAFPFSVVADAHRISKLVHDYDPEIRERREVAERKKAESRMRRPVQVFGIECVEQGTFGRREECAALQAIHAHQPARYCASRRIFAHASYCSCKCVISRLTCVVSWLLCLHVLLLAPPCVLLTAGSLSGCGM